MYFNCEGLINNTDEIDFLVKQRKAALLLLYETHVDDSVYDNELEINGYYSLKCLTDNRRTGGIQIYIDKSCNYIYKVVHNEQKEDFFMVLGS